MVGITVAGRTLLRPLYKRVAGMVHSMYLISSTRPWTCLQRLRIPDPPACCSPFFEILAAETNDSTIFNALTLLVVLGTSLITQLAGLSLALGAFLAGLLLAETEYHLQVSVKWAEMRIGKAFGAINLNCNACFN